MTELKEKIWEVESRQRAATEDFVLLAKRCEAGEDISAEQILAAADAAHKSARDFESYVGSFRHRRGLRQKQQKLHETELELQQIQQTLDAANDQLELAVARHQSECEPLQAKRYELQMRVAELRSVGGDLVRSCPSEELQARFRRLRSSGGIDDKLLREMTDF